MKALTVAVFEVVVHVVLHILFVEGLANLIAIFVLLSIAVAGAISHSTRN